MKQRIRCIALMLYVGLSFSMYGQTVVKPVDVRDYDATFAGYAGTGTLSYSTLYRDNQDYGASCGCGQGEETGSHPGVDIPAAVGTNIYAFASGTIYGVGTGCVSGNSSCNGGWGNYIVIRHEVSDLPSGMISEPVYSVYAHLSSLIVTSGSVTAGQHIGEMGNTGNSTASHLHFQIDRSTRLSNGDLIQNHPQWPGGDVDDPDVLHVVEDYTISPMMLIQSASTIPVGFFQESNGRYSWRTDGSSQRFRTRFDQAIQEEHFLGAPINNHPNSASGQGTAGVHLVNGMLFQDLFGDHTGYYHGYTTLIDGPAGVKLLKEGFWSWYVNHEGWLNLKAPTMDEFQVNSNGTVQQPFELGSLFWNPSYEVFVTKDGNQIPSRDVTVIYNDGTESLVSGSVEPDQITRREMKITKSGEMSISYYRAGTRITPPSPPTGIESGGVEIWHNGVYIGQTPLQVQGYEDFVYEYEAKVDGQTVPFSFQVQGDMIVEVPGQAPSGSGVSQVSNLTVTPSNPAPGSDNVTLSATIVNNSGASVTYPNLELIVLNTDYSSPGFREVHFDVTVGSGGSYSINRTFSISTSGEYYAAIRWSTDNLNWTFLAPTSGAENPKWFRIGDLPVDPSVIALTSLSAENADNLEPNEPHSLSMTVQEINNVSGMYAMSIQLKNAQGQVVKHDTQIGSYWDSVLVDASGTWTGFVPTTIVETPGEYTYSGRAFNYATSLWENLGSLNVSVSYDSVVQVFNWGGIPDSVETNNPFQSYCTLKLPAGEPVVYDTIGFQILDENQSLVGMVEQQYANQTFNPGVTHSVPIQFQGLSTSGTYHLRAAGYQNGVWHAFPAVYGVSEMATFLVYSQGGPTVGSFELTDFHTAGDTVQFGDSLCVNGQVNEVDGAFVLIDTIRLALKDSTGAFIEYFDQTWFDVELSSYGNFLLNTACHLPSAPGQYQIELHAATGGSQLLPIATAPWVQTPLSVVVVEAPVDPPVQNQLENPSFETGDFSSWYVYKRFRYDAEVRALGGAEGVYAVETIPYWYSMPAYSVALMQAVEVETSTQYVVQFRARAEANRSIVLTIANGNTPHARWSDQVVQDITTDWAEYTVTLTTSWYISRSATPKLSVQIGGLDAVQIDNIRFYEQVGLNKSGSEQPRLIPQVFSLHQNYPNPFNPSTTIKFDLPEARRVKLVVYDILGREVVRLLDGEYYDAGYQQVVWDARNVASGMYFYRIQAGRFITTKKMIVLK